MSNWHAHQFFLSDWCTKIGKFFSERMISLANLLANAHRTILDHDRTYEIVFLRMSKRIIERLQHKEDFTSVMFHDFLLDEYASANT